MQRLQYEDRIIIERADKAKILAKSGGRCCKCGDKLSVNSMTVDHYIPLSQGGNNDIVNLIPLCKNCNYAKDSNIIDPVDYVKYIGEKHLKELKQLYELYINDYKWYKCNNLAKEDQFVISYPLDIPSLQGGLKRKNGGVYGMQVGTAVVTKAVYSDLDAIYEYTKKYMNKYGLSTDNLKDVLTEVFNLGCLYIIRNMNDIIAILPIMIDKGLVSKGDEEERELRYLFSISGIPMMYQKRQYFILLRNVFDYIFGNLARLNADHVVTFEAQFPAEDEFLSAFFDRYSCAESESDGWRYTLNYATYETKKELEIPNTIFQKRYSEIFEIASNHIERLFNLPSLTPKSTGFAVTRQGSVAEKACGRKYRGKQRISGDIKKANNAYKRKREQDRLSDLDREMREYVRI